MDPPAYDAVLETGRSRGLNMYDAAYLELTLRLGVPLATLDSALAGAAASAGAAVLAT